MKSGELHSPRELVERVSEKSIAQLRGLLEAKGVSPEASNDAAFDMVRGLAIAIFDWSYFKDDKLGAAQHASLPSEVVDVAHQAQGHAAKLRQCLTQLQNWNENIIDFDVSGPRNTRKGVAEHIEDLRYLQTALDDFIAVVREPPNAPKLSAGIKGFRHIGLLWEHATGAPLPCSKKKSPPSPLYDCLRTIIDELDPSGDAGSQFTARAYVIASKKGGNGAPK